MLKNIHPKKMILIKKICYWLFLLPMLLPWFSIQLAQFTQLNNLFAWGTVIFVFALLPIIDLVIGKDPVNPDEKTDGKILSQQRYYIWLPLSCVPAYFILLLWGGHQFVNYDFSLTGKLGWLFSIGIIGGLAIAVAHELIHKSNKLEKNAGGFLLSMVCYSGFKVEHLRGHHAHVSTPEDASSARFNQSLYQFLPHAYKHNFLNAWILEKQKLVRRKQKVISFQNELIGWYGISLLFLIGFSLSYGWQGAVYFLAQSFIALSLLEIVNYLEHYGLHRRKLANGRYEPTNPKHSWNSNYFLTNILLFHLQRHSDHHAHATRRYQVLRDYPDSPQLPAGYPTMVLLALIPPLWRKIMNPRVHSYYKNEEEQLA